MARFMDSTPLRNVVNLQASLASVFCYLITSMDDANVYVAQRATLNIGTIHDAAIRVRYLKYKFLLPQKKKPLQPIWIVTSAL